MKIPVSKIKTPWLRRAAILLSFPILSCAVVPLILWNLLLDFIGWQINLLVSAKSQW